MLSFLIVAILSRVIAAQMDSASQISIAMVDVHNNYEFSTVYKSFRVHYPGICHTDIDKQVSINILQISDVRPVKTHTFVVPIDERTDPRSYIFGLQNAVPGKYAVQVCIDKDCSPISKSLTKIPSESEINELTCYNVVKEMSEEGSKKKWTVKSKHAGSFNTTLLPAPRLLSIKELEALPKGHFEWDKMGKKDVCEENPCYDEDSGLYVAYPYDLAHYKLMFIDPTIKENKETVSPATGATIQVTEAAAYCERKYLLSTVVHLLHPNTKQVMYRFKTTLESTQQIRSKYVFGTATEKIPIEVNYESNIVDGTYDLWLSVCATDKDAIESTICARPFVHTNFVVMNKLKQAEEKQKAVEEAARLKKEASDKEAAKLLKDQAEKDKLALENPQNGAVNAERTDVLPDNGGTDGVKRDAPTDNGGADGVKNDAPTDNGGADGVKNDAPTDNGGADGVKNDVPTDNRGADGVEPDTSLPVEEE